MKQSSLIILLLMATNVAKGQNKDTLIINTGYNDSTKTVIPIDSQDKYWMVTDITHLTSQTTLPYKGYASNWWHYSSSNTAGNPIEGSQWLTYGPDRMNVPAGEYDPNGGTITFKRTFYVDLPGNDSLVYIKALLRADNTITEIRVDSIVTNFTMPGTSNWLNPPDTFTYSKAMKNGRHIIEVVVKNIGVSQASNPAGFCLAGTITTSNDSGIISNNPIPPKTNSIATQLASTSSLGQNSPNPFHGYTSIKYNITAIKKYAYISINNIIGQSVYQYPINNSGKGTADIYTDNMMPGVYTYSLIVDGLRIQTRKMTIAN